MTIALEALQQIGVTLWHVLPWLAGLGVVFAILSRWQRVRGNQRRLNREREHDSEARGASEATAERASHSHRNVFVSCSLPLSCARLA